MQIASADLVDILGSYRIATLISAREIIPVVFSRIFFSLAIGSESQGR